SLQRHPDDIAGSTPTEVVVRFPANERRLVHLGVGGHLCVFVAGTDGDTGLAASDFAGPAQLGVAGPDLFPDAIVFIAGDVDRVARLDPVDQRRTVSRVER